MPIILYGEVTKSKLSKMYYLTLISIRNYGSNIYLHLHPGNGSYSSIDLTMVGPILLLDLHCTVPDDWCGSDHFLNIVEGSEPLKTDCSENWKLNKNL